MKVWCNSPNRSRRYQIFDQFSNFRRKKLFGADPSPVRCALASIGYPRPTVKFLGGNTHEIRAVCISESRPHCTDWISCVWRHRLRYERPIFRRLWTKVHQIWYARRGVIAVFNAVFRSTISCSRPEIFAIKSQNPKFWCFWAVKFFGGGTPQISDSHLKITVTTEHVAKFGDDRPRDLQD